MPDPAGTQRPTRWPWWKKAAIVLLAFSIAPVAIPIVPVAAFLAYDAISLHRFFARTPFVADLGGSTIDDQERQFAERVERALPIGTRVDALWSMLTAQGFSASPAYGGFDGRLQVEHASFPCRVDWNVLWSLRDGAVSAVRGDMATTCL